MRKWMNEWMNCLFLHLWLVETALFTLGTILSYCFFESFPLCFVTSQCTTALTPYIQIQPEILVLGNKHKNILKNTPTLGQLKSTHRGMAGMYVGGNWCLFMHLQCKWFITWFILRSFWLNSIFHDILSHRNSPFTHRYFELLPWPALWIWHPYSQTALLKGNGKNTVDLDHLSCRGSFDETNPRACWGWEIVFGARSPSPALSW